ncbi:MAG: hypothetical protein H6Q72_1301 [Firmicutes bacterium]|nr:hypothetical protein [Bacillota bacterium]
MKEEKHNKVGRPKVKEKRKPRSIKATEAEWKRIVKLLKQIDSPKAVAIINALESYLTLNGEELCVDSLNKEGESQGF